MDRFQALRVFTQIAQSGSFSDAAKALGMSKSAVSKLMAALEDHLGARLLYRTTRQVSLTEEGRNYYARACRILDDMEEADNEAANLRMEPRGTVRLSCALGFGIRHIAPILPEFLMQYDGVILDVDYTDRFVDLVDEGYDLAIRIGELADSSLIVRRLALSRLVPVASPAYLARHGTPLNPDHLKTHVCLAYRGRYGLSDWVFEGPDGIGCTITPKGAMVANNGTALLMAALGGLGIANIPAFMLGDALEGGLLLPLLPDWRQSPLPIQAVYAPNRHLSARVRLFIDFLAQRLKT